MRTDTDYREMRQRLARWVEANQKRAEALRNWAHEAMHLKDTEVAANLGAAVLGMEVVDEHLQAALHCRGAGRAAGF